MALPTWLHNSTIAVWDIETDYIPTTKMYCIGVALITVDNIGNYTTTPSKIFTVYWTPYSTGSLVEAIALINSCTWQTGHNTISFDIPEIRKLMNLEITSKPLDTLIISKLIFSKDELFRIDENLNIDKALHGRYSLKAFGQRLGDFKIDFEDFSGLTEIMAIYCNQDVDLTLRLFLFLLEKPNLPSWEVIELEHQTATIIAEQTTAGFYFDYEKARKLNTSLLKEKGELARELATMFNPKFLKDGKVKTYKKLSTTRKYIPNKTYKPLW